MKNIFLLLLTIFLSNLSFAQFKNPVISGMYPDPSICRVGDDFYLVNSTFSYFPGVPLFHSKDLVNWEQISNVLDRESQLPLASTNFWLGIYAPTIRYNDGTFYMVTTNVGVGDKSGNFYVTTTDINKPWSEPIFLKQGGIDPSFYFEDGKCYFSSNPEDGIWLCEINPKTGEQLTPSVRIWNGTGGRYPEGAHIYKKDDFYYLVISEGGTEFGHQLTIARSKNIYGPYQSNPANPILTHFNQIGQSNPIQGVGHADFVQAKDGSYWLVCLGFRTYGSNHHFLGRETFLAPISWPENAWPVVNGNGTISIDMNTKTLPEYKFAEKPQTYQFTFDKFPPEFVFYRNPIEKNYVLNGKNLTIKGSELEQREKSPSMILLRQKHIDFDFNAPITLNDANNGDKAGLTVFLSEDDYYDISLEKQDKQYEKIIKLLEERR